MFFLIDKHIWYFIFGGGGGVTCYSYRYSCIFWISLNEHSLILLVHFIADRKKTTALFYGVHEILFTIGTTALLSIIATSRYMYNSSYCMRQRAWQYFSSWDYAVCANTSDIFNIVLSLLVKKNKLWGMFKVHLSYRNNSFKQTIKEQIYICLK